MRRALTALAAAVLSLSALYGQTAASTEYFLDHNTFIYRYNPALVDRTTSFYVGALLPHITMSASSNVGVSDIFFPLADGSLVTGLNSNVSAQEFLGGLRDNNTLNLNADVNLLSFGRFDGQNLTTIELNLRSSTSGNIPKSMFSLLKEGTQGETYAISNLDGRTSNWLEGAIGTSVPRGPLTYGFRLKVMLGIADLSVHMDDLRATPVDGGVNVQARGSMTRAEGLLNADGSPKALSPAALDPKGFGMGVDFGLAYETDRFRVDAALLDLGAIRWAYSMYGDFECDQYVSKNYNVKDFLKDIYPDVSAAARFTALSSIVNIGGKYYINDWLSSGMLCTARLDGAWLEGRAGVTATPGDVFSCAASVGVSKVGASLGAAFNVRIPGLMFHFGIDDFIFQFTPQYIPVNAFDTTITTGLAIVF